MSMFQCNQCICCIKGRSLKLAFTVRTDFAREGFTRLLRAVRPIGYMFKNGNVAAAHGLGLLVRPLQLTRSIKSSGKVFSVIFRLQFGWREACSGDGLAFRGSLDRGDVDPLHGQHGLHCALRLARIGIGHQPQQHLRHDLPG